jgi:hypothetical protein
MSTKRKTIRKKPEAIVNNAPKLHASFEVGDVSHQGDLIVVRISTLPESAKHRANRQLAEGSTQGSRHVLARGEAFDCDPVEVQAAIKKATGIDVSRNYLGPMFVSPAVPTEHDLTHPEHGDQGFPPHSICAIVYQRNLDSEQREMRVID